MGDISKKMSEEDRDKNTNTPTKPKDEEALLSHMISTIRNLTRHPPNQPPKWTNLEYEHPMTEE